MHACEFRKAAFAVTANLTRNAGPAYIFNVLSSLIPPRAAQVHFH